MILTGKCKDRFDKWVLSDPTNKMFKDILVYSYLKGPHVRVEDISHVLLLEIYRQYFKTIGIICYPLISDSKDFWLSVVLHDDIMRGFFLINMEDDNKDFPSDIVAMENAILKANNFVNNCG